MLSFVEALGWHKFAGEYHALRDDRPPVRRALSDTDLALLLEVASSREDWFYAYVATILGAFADLRSVEIRHLQWQQIDFINGTIDIRRSKTAAGRRLLSMNGICRDTLLQLREQAVLINADEPEHYLFPAYVKNQADPTKPMKSWRSAWRSIRKTAGISARFHDLRVSAVTMLAEKGVPLAVIQAQIGHTSPEMVTYYTRIRRQAMDDVAAAPEPSSDAMRREGVTNQCHSPFYTCAFVRGLLVPEQAANPVVFGWALTGL